MLKKNRVSKTISPLIFLALLFASTCCAQAQNAEILKNPGFEGTYTGKAPNWVDNSWGNPYPSYSYTRETANIHGGAAAQRIQINSLGGGSVQPVQPHTFLKNRTYQASVWLRSSGSIPVQVMLRRAAANYNVFAVKTVQVGSGWQQVTITGTFNADVAGYFMIIPLKTGTIWIDDASLKDVTPANTANDNSVALQGVIPSSYFGLHVNCLGCFGTLPAVNFGTLRLWDMGARWNEVEPSNNSWYWTTIDYYVNKAHSSGVNMIYTLGITPQWASARPNESAIYGPGTAAEPANINDWRDYVRAVATRYKGKIKYYELWNEVNYAGFYTGSVDKMVELTRTAREELKAVDPDIVVISPAVTDTGMNWLDQFLFKEGGKYVDVIGWHWYFGLKPEQVLPKIKNAFELMKSYNISNKPLYNTEGAGAAKDPAYQPTDDEARANVGRAYILFWAHGVSNFSWYMWDRPSSSIQLSQNNRIGLRSGGVAYREVVGWLKGAQMTYKNVDSDNTWVIEIKRANGYTGHIVWNTEKQLNWIIPANWGVVRSRDLTGASINRGGVSTIQIGPAPILLE